MSGLRFSISDNSFPTLVIQDGATRVYRQIRYKPETPEFETIEQVDTLDDGGEIPISVHRNVTDTAEVYFGDTLAAAQLLTNQMNRFFEAARDRQRHRWGARVYMDFRPDNTAIWYRTEIFNGRAVLDDDALSSHQLPAGILLLEVHVTRRFYFESTTLSYVPLTNQHGSRISTGIPIYSTNDATHDNYVTIAGSDLVGDLAAPARIELVNTFASVYRRIYALRIGRAARSAPTPASLTLEAESATRYYPAVLQSGVGVYSNNQAVSWTWNDNAYPAPNGLIMGYWKLSGDMLMRCAGAPYRIVAQLLNASPDIQMQASLYMYQDQYSPGLIKLWDGGWVTLDTLNQQDLGTTFLPPYAIPTGRASNPVNLNLRVRTAPGVSSASITVDCLQLFPAENYRVLRDIGNQAPYGTTLIDDPVEGATYTTGWGDGGDLGNFLPDGKPIALLPGRTNTLYLMFGDPLFSGQLRIAYRPRRLTL